METEGIKAFGSNVSMANIIKPVVISSGISVGPDMEDATTLYVGVANVGWVNTFSIVEEWSARIR